MGERPKYNVERHKKATTRVTLRAVVVFYLLYLSWNMIRSSEDVTSMPIWVAWLTAALFAAAAIGFGVYAYRQYLQDLKAAEVHPEDAAPADEEQTDEADEREDNEP